MTDQTNEADSLAVYVADQRQRNQDILEKTTWQREMGRIRVHFQELSAKLHQASAWYDGIREYTTTDDVERIAAWQDIVALKQQMRELLDSWCKAREKAVQP